MHASQGETVALSMLYPCSFASAGFISRAKAENIWKGRSGHKKLEAGWTDQILIWLAEPVS